MGQQTKFDLRTWVTEFVHAIEAEFGERVAVIGLQGSHRRGEARADSDVDMVVILDKVTGEDLRRYRALLERMPQRERACGFFSGCEELRRWDPGELFQFYYDTLPLRGNLAEILAPPGRAAARRAVRSGACAVYHAACHNFLHAQSRETMKALCKSARFILQAKCYVETGRYCEEETALAESLEEADCKILSAITAVRREADAADAAEMCALLVQWSGALLRDQDAE